MKGTSVKIIVQHFLAYHESEQVSAKISQFSTLDKVIMTRVLICSNDEFDTTTSYHIVKISISACSRFSITFYYKMHGIIFTRTVYGLYMSLTDFFFFLDS